MLTKSKSTVVTILVNRGSAEWRKLLDPAASAKRAVTEGKKTKEKESIRGVKIDVL